MVEESDRLGATPAPFRFLTMKANETADGEKRLKRAGNVVSILAQQVRGYEHRKRLLVLGRSPYRPLHSVFST